MLMITEEQRDALVQYLNGRPYGEVAGGIQLLMGLPDSESEAKEQVKKLLKDS